MQAMNELQLLSEKLHIPDAIKELAAVIYRKALEETSHEAEESQLSLAQHYM
jgi:transcription initiation factor TFIIIB Brf1 subunit/transcription initiation factor TFIIB